MRSDFSLKNVPARRENALGVIACIISCAVMTLLAWIAFVSLVHGAVCDLARKSAPSTNTISGVMWVRFWRSGDQIPQSR